MSNEERVFQRGETVPIYSDVRDWDGNLVTPTSIDLTVYDPDNTAVVDDVAMTELSTGKYVHYYNSAVDATIGWYRAEVTEVDGAGGDAKTTIKHGGFELH